MTVLVTGSNGFLGAALVERLVHHRVEGIRCFVREGSDRSRLELLRQRYPHAKSSTTSGPSPAGKMRRERCAGWIPSITWPQR